MRKLALLILIARVVHASAEYGFQAPLSPAQAKGLAQGIETQLAELSRKEEAERRRYVQATVAIGSILAMLEKQGALEAKAAEVGGLMAEFQRISEEHHKASDPLVLKIAVRARQLQKYRDAGDLSIDDSEVAELKEALFRPRTAIPEAKPLPLDIKELRRYLDAWWQPAKDRGPKQELPAPKALPARPAPALAGAGLSRDSGRGRPQVDPVPALIEQLASSDARQRALAADALGARSPASEAAARALRQALHDQDGRVRASAVLSLGAAAASVPGVPDDIRTAVKDKDPDVRFSARAALQRLGLRP